MSKADAIRDHYRVNPSASPTEVATMIGCAESTVRKVRDSMTEPVVEIPVASIDADLSLQLRDVEDGVEADTVARYARSLDMGKELPPILLYQVGPILKLVDGFQRLAAYMQVRRAEIPAVVRQGTFDDALLAAASANERHGLPRTEADRRKAAKAIWSRIEASHLWTHGEWSKRIDVHPKTIARWFKDGILGDAKPEPPARPDSVAGRVHPEVRAEVEDAEGTLDADQDAAEEPDESVPEPTAKERLVESLPAWSRSLAGKQATLYNREVDLYLAVSDELAALERAIRAARSRAPRTNDGSRSVLEYQIERLLSGVHPRERKCCLDCGGTGCQSCGHRGYI